MTYFCDNNRHLVCFPYSIENLHLMAKNLKIGKHWFHKGKNGKSHYDIPKTRIKEIQSKCIIVDSKIIIKITRGALPLVDSKSGWVFTVDKFTPSNFSSINLT